MTQTYHNAIRKARIVSFDIFDTALLRNVLQAHDVFGLVQLRYEQAHSPLPFNFAKERVLCEKELRDEAWQTRHETEVLLDDIYAYMLKKHRLSADDAEQLKALELSIEGAVCVRNPFVHSLYEYARSLHKPVIFVSDIYLPQRFIADILHKEGYNGYHKLYTSSSYKRTKATGTLYDLVLQDLQIPASSLLHIGDNKQSDIEMASTKGIRVVYYEKCATLAEKEYKQGEVSRIKSTQEVLFDSLLGATVVNKFLSNRDECKTSSKEQFWYRFGYEKAGVLLLGFCLWILKRAKEDRVDRLFFLARDGYVLQKIVDLLTVSGGSRIQTEYLLASRRAYNFANIRALGEKEIRFLIYETSYIPLGQYFKRIGIDFSLVKDKIQQFGFKNAEEYVSNEQKEDLRKLFLAVEDLILERAAQERANLLDYFKEFGIKDGQTIGMVDIGWNGSLQTSFAKLLKEINSDNKTQGYYLGTWEGARNNCSESVNIHGYLCEFSEPESYKNLLKECVEIFEFIHLAPDGSLICFESEEGKPKPLFDAVPSEIENYQKAKILHEGIFDFVADFMKSYSNFPEINFEKEIAIAPLKRVLQNPTQKELVCLGDLIHSSDFGILNSGRYIARPSLDTLLFRKSKKYQKELENAYWKIGYEKRLQSENPLKRLMRSWFYR
jgi:predicted HAD superfamily hydrolase